MYDEKTIRVERAVFLIDVLLTILVFVFSFLLRNVFATGEEADFFSHLALLPLLLVLIVSFLTYSGAYKSPRYMNLMRYGWAVFRGLFFSIALLLMLLFVLKIQYVSRYVIVFFASLELMVIFGVRAWLRWYFIRSLKKGSDFLRVLIIGTGDRAKECSEELRKQSEWGIKIIGHLDPDPGRLGKYVMSAPVIGTVDDITHCLKDSVVDEVIIAIPRSMINDVERIAQACEEEGIKLRFMADLFNLQVARIRLIQIGKIPLLTLEPVAQDEIKLLVKRCVDFILTLLAMPILLPITGIFAIAIKLDSPGPAFFVQQRVGLKKRLFPMLKFRSMHLDAEEKMKEIEHLNEAEGPIFKIANDPRVTRVGHFLRKTSLDELPQLFNVLKGQMSLVGPRPMSIRDVDLFDQGVQRKRFSVKPGITCIWQISGRSNLPFSTWIELDLKYIDSWTLWLDLKILFKTIPAVFMSKGAV